MIKALARTYLSELKDDLDRISLGDLDSIVHAIFEAYKKSKQVFVMGNGGSAATASHFACNASHLNLGLKKGLKVLCLSDGVPTILAIANDRSHEEIFVEQLRTLLNPGDVVIGISASGNSRNVIRAVEYANRRRAISLAITGFDGGRLARIARFSIVVPGGDIKKIEDAHLILTHIVTHALKSKIEGSRKRRP